MISSTHARACSKTYRTRSVLLTVLYTILYSTNYEQTFMKNVFLGFLVRFTMELYWLCMNGRRKKVILSPNKMAGRLTSALCYCLIIYLIFVIKSYDCQRFGEKAKTLHIASNVRNPRSPIIIQKDDDNIDDEEKLSSDRKPRDAPQHHNNPNIVTKVINDY